jgi:hypothetical protein
MRMSEGRIASPRPRGDAFCRSGCQGAAARSVATRSIRFCPSSRPGREGRGRPRRLPFCRAPVPLEPCAARCAFPAARLSSRSRGRAARGLDQDLLGQAHLALGLAFARPAALSVRRLRLRKTRLRLHNIRPYRSMRIDQLDRQFQIVEFDPVPPKKRRRGPRRVPRQQRRAQAGDAEPGGDGGELRKSRIFEHQARKPLRAPASSSVSKPSSSVTP